MQQNPDLLTTQLLAGRGLWIGLAPANPPAHWPTPCHLTLAYVGKLAQVTSPYVSQQEAHAAHLAGVAANAARRVSEEFLKLSAGLGGEARFRGVSQVEGDPHVVLVQSPALRPMRQRVLDLLEAHSVELRPTFDYTPHVTLGRVPHDAPLTLLRAERSSVEFDRAIVVCGDATLTYPMGDRP